VPQPAATLPKLAKVINKSLIKSSSSLFFYPFNEALCPAPPLISLILSSSLISLSFDMTESPVISNDRATFSRGQSMKRTGRHVFLKLWPSKADGSLMYQSCPLSKEKTHTHLHRGVSLRGTLPLLAWVWLLLFKLSSVQLRFTFMQQRSERFFKRYWDSSWCTSYSFESESGKIWNSWEPLEISKKNPLVSCFFADIINSIKQKRNKVNLLLANYSKKKKLNTRRQQQKTNVIHSEIKILF